MPRNLFETEEQKAERIAREHGWRIGIVKQRFASFGDDDLIPFYFYHARDDILDTEHKSWADLCASQPILAAALGGEE